MLKKAINHVIMAKRARTCQEKYLERQGCGCSFLATSTPLNPKSKVQNQGKEDQVKKQYLVFLVKKEESRDFDIFFGVFFGVWGREKTQREVGQKVNFRKNVFPPCLGHTRGYLQPRARKSRQRPLKGLNNHLIRLILTPLDRS